jgi:hypothetical protein
VRYLLTAIALALATDLYAADPPAAQVTPAYSPAAKPGCICGDDCKCKPGVCPNKCPVAAADPRLASVYVSVDMGNGSAAGGTGTIVGSENGRLLVLTNAHVVEDSRHAISVTYWSDGQCRKTAASYITGSSVSHLGPGLIQVNGPDLCLVELPGNAPAVEIAEEIPRVGAPVRIYGFGGAPPDGKQPILKTGTYAGTPGWVTSNGDAACRTTINSVNGDSGSGIFNDANELVAVHWGGGAVRLDAVHAFTVKALKSQRVLFPRLHDRLADHKIMRAIMGLPEKEPPAAKAKPKPQPDAYAALCWHVAKGGKGVLYLGVPAPESTSGIWAKLDNLPGYTAGVYDCYLGKDGVPMMQIRTAPKAANPFGACPTCPNGKCPNPRR